MKKLLHFFSIPVFIAIVIISSCTQVNIDKPAEQAGNNNNDNTISSRVTSETVVTSVARIKEIQGGLKIMFNERQAVYFLYSSNPRYTEASKTAREALATGKPIKFTSEQTGILATLAWPSSGEISAYLEWYKKNLIGVDTSRVLHLAGLDTIAFNLASNQKWKAFNLCFTIPDLPTLQTIFNFCKQQACTAGATQVTPCIPFDHVEDGCFARAHKMRYIIESIYKYCSQKVFSFGDLYVNASLWGGCCVNWSYHVAPLVRVRVNGQSVCYVIDPAMFNAPVTLTTWLNAQANTSCNAAATVTGYSIQPSSAYTPAGPFPPTAFTTDSAYIETDRSLTFARIFGPTCGN